ncbi:MAG TPA: peptidyl-prolyl cis-trans isomerase [Solirubrobacteraceae bacterium]
MARMSLAILLTIAALSAVPTATAQAPALPADAAATVGDRPIATATVEHWITIARRSAPAKRAALVEQVMQFLISAEWVRAEATQQGITVTPEQVRAEFARTKKQSFRTEKEFQEFLAESGQTLDDILFRVEVDLLSTALRKKATSGLPQPTEARLRSYYRTHKRQFRRPRLHVAVIVERRTKRAAQRALDAVRSGRSWTGQGAARRAAEYLTLPRLAWHIRHARRGVPSGPVKSVGRWYVFELRRIHPARQRTYQQSRAAVRARLTAEAEERALGAFLVGFNQYWKAKTVCRRGYSTEDCGTIIG